MVRGGGDGNLRSVSTLSRGRIRWRISLMRVCHDQEPHRPFQLLNSSTQTPLPQPHLTRRDIHQECPLLQPALLSLWISTLERPPQVVSRWSCLATSYPSMCPRARYLIFILLSDALDGFRTADNFRQLCTGEFRCALRL